MKSYLPITYLEAAMPNNPPQQLINTQICQQNKRLNMLLFETDAVYSEAAKRLGLIDSDYKILYTMCHLGSKCLLADVVRLSGCNKQTVNSAMRRMEAEELIYLQKADDGRRKLICLTEKGQNVTQNTIGRLIELENEAMLNWTEQETALYIELTQRFLQDLKEKIKRL